MYSFHESFSPLWSIGELKAKIADRTMYTPKDFRNQPPDLNESRIPDQIFRKNTVGNKNKRSGNSLDKFKWSSYPSIPNRIQVRLEPVLETTYIKVILQNIE